MRVGILTTFFSKNYGAALQAYATYKVVEKLGYSAELIQYCKCSHTYYVSDEVVKEQKKLPLAKKLGRKVRNFLIKIKRPDQNLINGAVIRDKAFDSFVAEHLKLSEASYTSPEAFLAAVPQMPYDVFLSGSDQIWNPIVHNFDDVYYLNFSTNVKKVSYASSVAYNHFSEREIQRICDAISSIDCISVREKSTVSWMQPHMKKKVNHVIDPTFLLDKDAWLDLKSDKVFGDRYILLYLLNYNEQNNNIPELVGDLARKTGSRIICLPYTSIRFPKDIEIEYRYDIAPNDFIHLINSAQCVITNSFHATALSINLNIPFYVVSSRERNKDLQTRLSDLLEETRLESRRIYKDTKSICFNHEIDYGPVNQIISQCRDGGISFLKQALECDI